MTSSTATTLHGPTVLVPGGTGGVGEGVVRAYLAAGADVVVPSRSTGRADQLRAQLGPAATERLHLVAHDYTSFAGARELVDQVVRRLGGLDSVVAPIGGWWQGGPLSSITERDWSGAFVDLATTHAAVLRAALPVLGSTGAYTVVVGDSAAWPVPGSGLVSMEQAAVLMMQRVAAAESGSSRRVFSLVLGPVTTRFGAGEVDALDVGRVAVALAASTSPSATVGLHDRAEAEAALEALTTAAG
jgi:NAD(P)-dependent dehydrogenase (short-subunit alcohol dehydrogenase family)